jgi:hypothetical protein
VFNLDSLLLVCDKTTGGNCWRARVWAFGRVDINHDFLIKIEESDFLKFKSDFLFKSDFMILIKIIFKTASILRYYITTVTIM